MNHTNIKESNYELFCQLFDPEKKLSNKDRSALHVAYLIKNANDKGIRVGFNYHTFIHGEEGDSENVLEQNRKGSISFSFNESDISVPREQYSHEEFYYDRTQLAFISLNHTKLLKYINKMVPIKYPSNETNDHDKIYDSREKFAEQLYSLKHEKIVNGVLVERAYNRITSDNFSNFLNILLTDELLIEFDKIVNPSNNLKEEVSENLNISRFKLK